jgi:3',5'-cyclic AMP phosphodiesterase CpdA
MKKYVIGLILVFSLSNVLAVLACSPFSFALLTDLHLSPTNPQAEEDLQNSVNEVNKNSEIEFVLVTGDITDAGDRLSLLNAKKCLDNLNKPYYIVPGNHELKWSESGATDFPKIFGDDKFSFSHTGIFICRVYYRSGH